MTAPIYQSKTWQYANNDAQRTAASARDANAFQAWYLAALLTGNIALRDFDDNAILAGSVLGKWTIEWVSNGVVAGAPGVVGDVLHLASSYSLADWVRANAGSPHSGIVLKSPVSMGPFYINIDDSGSQPYYFQMNMSKSAYTGGDASNKPTAANESVSGDMSFARNVAPGAGRKRAGLCTDGNFFCLDSTDGEQRFTTYFIGATLAETRTGDNHNFWVMSETSNNTPGVPFGNPSGLGCHLGRSAIAGAIITPGLFMLTNVSNSQQIHAVIPGRDATDHTFSNSSIVIATSTPASERGRLVDFTWCAQGVIDHINGDLVPDVGIGEFVRSGTMYFPSNGVMQGM